MKSLKEFQPKIQGAVPKIVLWNLKTNPLVHGKKFKTC